MSAHTCGSLRVVETFLEVGGFLAGRPMELCLLTVGKIIAKNKGNLDFALFGEDWPACPPPSHVISQSKWKGFNHETRVVFLSIQQILWPRFAETAGAPLLDQNGVVMLVVYGSSSQGLKDLTGSV